MTTEFSIKEVGHALALRGLFARINTFCETWFLPGSALQICLPFITFIIVGKKSPPLAPIFWLKYDGGCSNGIDESFATFAEVSAPLVLQIISGSQAFGGHLARFFT